MFVGDNRPVTRATIQKAIVSKTGSFRTLPFDQSQPMYEIPNIKTCQIDRRLSTDAATMTLTFANLGPLTEGENLDQAYDPNLTSSGATSVTRRSLKDLGRPGLYSYRRGVTPLSAELWGHDTDPIWVDMFIPNRLIRTFQGYGTDGAVNPHQDAKLVMTGMWLIDKVEYKANATIVLSCRDLGKLLIEQRLYPPIAPLDFYITGGIRFCADHIKTEVVQGSAITTTDILETLGDNVAKHISSGNDSSVAFYYGNDGSIFGHKASHAFDGDETTYWMSVGNSGPTEVWSYEWIEANTNGEPINRVRFKQKWGNYKIYVGVKESGVWQGTDTVPYGFTSEPAKPNDSNRPFVLEATTPSGDQWVEFDLPRVYQAERVRVTFTNLADSDLGTFQYRAAVFEFEVRNFTPASTDTIITTTTEDVDVLVPGNITDYTDIIKVFCAWSGFWWPGGSADPALESFSGDLEGASVGRVWGDFFYSGAFPVDPPCIPPSFWDNKSVMDGVNQIKEILGFIFYVDSTGGVVWRMPNIWRTGNFITGVGYIGQDSVRDISESQVLIDYGVTVDDTNLRSEIIVVVEGDPLLTRAIKPGWAVGEVVPSAVDTLGDLALLGGQERIMLVPNYPFQNQAEVDKFAYLISLWIHWSYRKSKVRIPGNPAFEPDDQVRIFERVTSESYIHYIQGVRSTMDLDSGTWFCDLDTHWLGNGPDAEWVVNTYSDMPPALYAYLLKIGEIKGDDPNIELPPGWDPTFVLPDFPDEVPRLDEDLDNLFPDPPPTIFTGIDDTISDEEIVQLFGDGSISGEVYHRSEAWRFAYWGSPASLPKTKFRFVNKWLTRYTGLSSSERIGIRTFPGQTVTRETIVPSVAKAAFVLLAEILIEETVNVFSCSAFAGTTRKIANTNRLSAHAWGLAIDINPTVFTCCSTPRSTIAGRTDGVDFLRAGERIVNLIRTNNGNKRVFGWGGKWRTKADWMHFEVIVTPAELASGVHR